jgi:hypothetical protein
VLKVPLNGIRKINGYNTTLFLMQKTLQKTFSAKKIKKK